MDLPAIMNRALHMDDMHMLSVTMPQGRSEIIPEGANVKVKPKFSPQLSTKRFAEHGTEPSQNKKFRQKVSVAVMHKNNLCFGYGQANHAIKDCPKKQGKPDHKEENSGGESSISSVLCHLVTCHLMKTFNQGVILVWIEPQLLTLH